MNWRSKFEVIIEQPPGASEQELQEFLSELARPLSAEERCMQPSLHNSDEWKFPANRPPAAYLSLLSWSNGGAFQNGSRRFNFFPVLGDGCVREMMILYSLPEICPGALPFAFNGGGNFYCFDMREEEDRAEYPILAVSCGFDNSGDLLASSFLEAVSGTESIEEMWDRLS